MINRTAIQQWSNHAPWIDNAQIEQDLIICRALVAIFSDEFLASQLASVEEQPYINSICRPNHAIVRTLTWFRSILVISSPSCIVLVKRSIFFQIESRNKSGTTIPCCSELSLKYHLPFRFA